MAMQGLRIGGGQAPVEDEMMDQMAAASDPSVIPMEEETPVEAPAYSGGQVDPAIARYFAPEYMCNNCIHFMDPNACQIVAGEINPEGICSLHTPDATSMSQPEEELAEPIEESPPVEAAEMSDEE